MKRAEFYRLLGEQIRRLRVAKGETQTELARKLKVKPNEVNRWEMGVYRPSVQDIDRLAMHFDVSPLDFFPTREAYEMVAMGIERARRLRSGASRNRIDE